MQIEYVTLIYFPLLPLFLLGTFACFMKNKNFAYGALFVPLVLALLETLAMVWVPSINEYNEIIIDMLKMQVFSLGMMAIAFMAMFFVIRPLVAYVIRTFERHYNLRPTSAH